MSEHFSIAELIYSQTASAHQISNALPDALLPNAERLIAGLEEVRAALGDLPITLTSGYRCAALNKLVGGSANSAHMECLAADFTCWRYGTPEAIVGRIIEAGITFDQCIVEERRNRDRKVVGRWVHISFDPRARGRVMHASVDAQGKATYT